MSWAGASRDPKFFPEPGRFDIRRVNARQKLGFALGAHVCVGVQLARMETQAAITALLDGLPFHYPGVFEVCAPPNTPG